MRHRWRSIRRSGARLARDTDSPNRATASGACPRRARETGRRSGRRAAREKAGGGRGGGGGSPRDGRGQREGGLTASNRGERASVDYNGALRTDRGEGREGGVEGRG